MSAEEGPRVLPSPSAPFRHRKAAEVIAQELRRSIVQDGRAGDYLPPERHLIEQFQVSRPTLREALRVLESEGLVEIRRGIRGGAVVREPAVEDLALRFGVFLQMSGTSLEDLFLVRNILEPAAARMAAEAVAGGASMDVLDELLAAEADALAAMKEDRTLSGVLVDFHDGVLQVAGSITLSVVWKLLDRVVGPYTFSSLVSFPGREARLHAVQQSHSSHKAITKAIRAGDANRAERVMRVHLDAVREATGVREKGRMVDMFAEVPDHRDGPARTVSAGDGEAPAPTRPRRLRSNAQPSD